MILQFPGSPELRNRSSSISALDSTGEGDVGRESMSAGLDPQRTRLYRYFMYALSLHVNLRELLGSDKELQKHNRNLWFVSIIPLPT